MGVNEEVMRVCDSSRMNHGIDVGRRILIYDLQSGAER